ncbi:MAG: hypothetical protein ABW220_12255 [Burkholderiaceae bacterium]
MRKSSLFAGLCLAFVCLAAQAQDPPWLAEMPSIERVLADTQGKNPLDTKARQAAAFVQLRRSIEDLAERRRVTGFLPEETRLMSMYWDGYSRVEGEAKALAGPADGTFDSPWAKWLAAEGRYERDPAVRAEVLTRYLSAETRTRLNITNAETAARVRESNREMYKGLGVEQSFWDEMDPEERESALGFALLMVLMLGVLMIRELRRFGLVSTTPPIMQAGFRRYSLAHATGIVTGYTKTIETHKTTTTTRHETGQTSTSVSSQSWTHEYFTLKWDGGEHAVHVVNADLDVSNGSLVTAVWGLRKRATTGDYFIFFDRSTQRQLPIIGVLQAALAPTRWLMLPTLLIAMVVSGGTGLWLALLPATNSLLRAFLGLFAGWVLMLAVLGLTARFRAKRFARRDGPPLLEAIEAGEAPALSR